MTMLVEIIVTARPGVAISEATLAEWHVAVSDLVEEGQRVAEISTDKIAMEVEAPVRGRLVDRLVDVNEDFSVPGVIGHIKAIPPFGDPVDAGNEFTPG